MNTDSQWTRYVHDFVEGGRVRDTGNGNISHSEGQGWGMLLAEANADRKTFDRLWTWTQRHLRRSDIALFSWRYDPARTPHVQDPNNATDGDVLIAWALLRAADRWSEPEYEKASREIRKAIRERLVINYRGRTVLLPGLVGFETDGRVIFNPSYLVAPALLTFSQREPSAGWERVLDDGLWIIEQARFGTYGLPTDWVALKPDGTFAPAEGWPARFGFDAVRVPLYLNWAGLSPLGPIFQPFKALWSCCKQVPAWIDVHTGELSPYPASTGVKAVASLLSPDAMMPTPGAKEDYYSMSLLLLSRLAAAEQSRR
ncbi:glycosyl hydrolase family 8 [Pseudomonas sp. Marseille-QA0892]